MNKTQNIVNAGMYIILFTVALLIIIMMARGIFSEKTPPTQHQICSNEFDHYQRRTQSRHQVPYPEFFDSCMKNTN